MVWLVALTRRQGIAKQQQPSGDEEASLAAGWCCWWAAVGSSLTDLISEHEGTYYSCSTTVRLQKMYEHCVHFPDSLQRRLVEPYLVELQL